MLKPDPAHPRYAEAMGVARHLATAPTLLREVQRGLLTHAEMVDVLAHNTLRTWDQEAADEAATAGPTLRAGAHPIGVASFAISLTGPQVERVVAALEGIAAALARIAEPELITGEGSRDVRVQL